MSTQPTMSTSDKSLICSLTAQLMSGGNPDNLNVSNVPRMMDVAEAIYNECNKRYPVPPNPVV